jgi:cysteine desulfurase
MVQILGVAFVPARSYKEEAMHPIYFDNNATTPLSSEARVAMEPYLEGQYGNPLTTHRFGESPRAAVEAARDDVAALVGSKASECDVLFNSGGTEGLNHAVKGFAFHTLENGRAGRRRRIVLGGIEHYAVVNGARWLAERFGFEVIEVNPGRDGVVPVDSFVEELDAETTALAALQWANNEVGTTQPVREVGRVCRELKIPFVCDAVQAAGKLDLGNAFAAADAWAFSAHKLHGPKGVGALVLRKGVEIDPLLHGAAQENGLRAGTHNVAGIVGFAAAARAARRDLASEATRLGHLRDLLWAQIHQRIDRVAWNGQGAPMLPNTLNVSFEGCPSQSMCEEMDRRGFSVAAGAACHSGESKPSHTILAMGHSEGRAYTNLRVSLGRETTRHDVLAAADAFAESVRRMRGSL